jgi:branched-chain amino acid transport system permease protein
MSGRYTTNYRQDMRLLRTLPQRWIAILLTIFAIALPFILELDFSPPFGLPWSAWSTTINLALIAVIGAAAFNLLLGYTHQISVAHAAFLILGTITAGWLGSLWGWPFLVVLLVAAVFGAVVGVIVGLPALRLRGLYLLIATFGVHYFALLAYRKFQIGFFGFSAMRFDPPALPSILNRLAFIDPDEEGQFRITGNFRWYWVLLPITALSVLFMINVLRTREGRAFRAIAQHDVSAALIGINVTKSKLLSFAVSSAFVSMSGALSAYYIGARGEDSFPFSVVLNYAIMIIVGGFSTMQGAVLGAFFFYLAPVLFAWARDELPLISSIDFLRRYEAETDLAIFGALIIIVLVLRPTGLAGMWQGVKRYFAQWPYSA